MDEAGLLKSNETLEEKNLSPSANPTPTDITIDKMPIPMENNPKVMKNHVDFIENLEDDKNFNIISPRSSTPYTSIPLSENLDQPELNSSHVSPVKIIPDTSMKGGYPSLLKKDPIGNEAAEHSQDAKCQEKSSPCKSYRYSRDLMMQIRSKLNTSSETSKPNVLYCDDIELEVKLKKFYIFKTDSTNDRKISDGGGSKRQFFTYKGGYQNKQQSSSFFREPWAYSNVNKIHSHHTPISRGGAKGIDSDISYTENKRQSSPSFHSSTDSADINPCNVSYSNSNIITVDKLEATWRKLPLSRNTESTTPTNMFHLKKFSSNESPKYNPKPVYETKKSPMPNNTANDALKYFIEEIQMKESHEKTLAKLQQQQQQAALIASLHMKTVLRRPECQIILQNLIKGEISKHGLLIQLANPNLTQRDRESITAVLTYTSEPQPIPIDYNNNFLNLLKRLEASTLERNIFAEFYQRTAQFF